MEVTYYEDPACSWCWAFEPVATTLAFEFGHLARFRHVMGGLRNRPPTDVEFIVGQWQKAEALFAMPFDTTVWESHVLQTTHLACRAVKAAFLLHPEKGVQLLRRLREAYFTERLGIDSYDTIARLAGEVEVDADAVLENIASGRAEELFARDRAEASTGSFGFPTTILASTKQDQRVLLQGSVDYAEILNAVNALGISQRMRRRFLDSPEHWLALFEIHPRLAPAEIRLVTQLNDARIAARTSELGIHWTGVFYELKRSPGSTLESTPATVKITTPGEGIDNEVGQERSVQAGAAPAVLDLEGSIDPEI